MTQIKVELLDSCCTDLDTVNAARVSFDKESEWEWWDVDGRGPAKSPSPCGEYFNIQSLTESDAKLIKYLAAHKHMSPFRHNFIKLRCKAPIFLAAQLKKHQAGLSWNEVSRRYVSTEPEFYVPEVWRGKPEGSVKQGSGGVFIGYIWTEDVEGFDAPMERVYEHTLQVCEEAYTSAVEAGIAPEMARMVLPQSMMTEFIWSGNLLAFAHVFNERKAAGAQQEAQEFAQQLNDAIGDLAPVSWKALMEG